MQPSGSGRLSLLRRAPQYRLLFLATLGSSFGTYLAALALTIDVYDRTGSGKWVAALLVADFLPIILIGITLGPLVDRLSRRRLMVNSDLVRLAVFCLLPFATSAAAIVALAAVAGVATGFFRPAAYAGLPNLVADDDLTEANSRLGGVENLSWMIAPVLGGALIATTGPDWAYWINAVTFLVSAALVMRIPADRLQSEESLSRGHWRDVADGLSVVRTSRPLLTVLVVWNAVMLGNAIVNVAEIIYAKDALGTGNLGFGVLVGATGLGLTIGSFLSASAIGSLGVRQVYVGSVVLMGVAFGLAALAPALWVAVPLVVAGTLGNGAAIVCNQLFVQRGAPDRLRGRALAVLLSSFYVTQILGMATAGLLTDSLGGRAMWAVAGVLYLGAAAVGVAMTGWLRSAAAAVPGAQPEPVPTWALGDAAVTSIAPRALERIALLLEEIEQTRRAETKRSA